MPIDAIWEQFHVIIDCQKVGGYRYYIANPEDIDEDRLKKWILDSFAVGSLIGENLALKDRIMIDEIPSGRDHLTTILEAMKENRVLNVTYKPFWEEDREFTFPLEPYCVKLFENRWYLLGRNNRDKIRIYGLDRLISIERTAETFNMPKDFSAEEFFSTYFGVVIGDGTKPERIIIRAYENHKHYLRTLPLHHSQTMIEDHGDYADFDLYLSPTFDFIMKLLQAGALVEVLKPLSLRQTMKGWVSDMYELYNNDSSDENL